MKKICLAAVAAATMFAATGAGAATIVTSRTAFDAQGAGTGYFNSFDSITAETMTPFTFGTFTANGEIRGFPTGVPGNFGNVNGTGWLQFRLDLGIVGILSSSTAFRSIGFDFRPYQGDEGELVRYLTDTGETGTFSLPSTNSIAFLGLIFDSATTSITFETVTGGPDTSSYFGIDNFQSYTAVAGATAVPEPASWALMILGVGAVGGALRRRVKVATTVRFA